MSLQPTSPEEVQRIVHSNRNLLPVGGGTKPALSAAANGEASLDMSQITGIIEYEPGEYTFTAYAGTPVDDIVAALAENRQYLPFDPPLVKQGATLGGVVAANTAGSGRYRFGGVRDFITGVRFVDGKGQLVKGGGKVVKNAAGFDLPKFMVGSAGRYGVFIDVSFKVFPEPRAYVTLKVTFPSLGPALDAIYRLGRSSNEMDILDLEPLKNNQFALVIRLGGLANALPGRIDRLRGFLKSETDAGADQLLEGDDDANLWAQMNGFGWAPTGSKLVKVPVSPKRISMVENVLHKVRPPRRYTAGGNVAWLAVEDIAKLDSLLNTLMLSGLVLIGPPGKPFVGVRRGLPLARRVKQALDPDGTFSAI